MGKCGGTVARLAGLQSRAELAGHFGPARKTSKVSAGRTKLHYRSRAYGKRPFVTANIAAAGLLYVYRGVNWWVPPLIIGSTSSWQNHVH
jgi:hypothetical protein